MANLVRKNIFNSSSFNRLLNLNKKLTNQKYTVPLIFNRNFSRTAQLDKIVAFNLSDIGEGIRDVVIKEWYVKEGDKVEQFDNICEVQSDKASVTITSRYDGKIAKLHHKVDDVALVGKVLLDFEVDDEEDDAEEKSSSSSSDSSSDEDEKPKVVVPKQEKQNLEQLVGKALATPAVRRIAMENQVRLVDVKASGKQGRVLKSDILEHIQKGSMTLAQKTSTKSIQSDTIIQLKGVRKVMFKSMSESLKIPHFGYKDEIDLTKLVQLREELKDDALTRGAKLTFMPFFIKAASIALAEFKILNSTLDVEKESVILKSAHNIGVAMDTAQGLVVPNIKNCQDKTIWQLAIELNELIRRGQADQLRPDDFSDGTFTLSNIGIIGGTYTHPCIMPPQVSIGAIGKTKILPRFGDNDEIFKAHIMNISWSADHRVIEGVTMAKFSNLWKKLIENPNAFLIF